MQVTAHPASQRAIDTRDLPLSLRATRVGIGLLKRVSRRAAARTVARLFVQPRRHPVPEREVTLAARAERRTVRHTSGRGEPKDVAVLVWSPEGAGALDPERTCVLVHGWEGRGTQLGSFVDPLLAKGWQVVTFDHVGHGASEGRASALPTMRDTLRTVVETVLAEPPGAVIAHSMGSFATTLLLAEGWRTVRVAYISPPDDLLVYFGHYLDIVVGDQDLLPDLVRIVEERFGENAEDFHFHRLVESLVQPLLIVHSTDDFDVPIEAGRYVHEHWPGARMVEVEGLGHRRILRDPAVVHAVVDFVTAPSDSGSGVKGPEDGA